MLTYNRPQYIDSAIRSVLKQTFQQWELLVVQDGENTLCQKKLEGWVRADARIRYFRREMVGTIGNAMNFGLRLSTGEFVAVLDDDDEWEGADKLEVQILALSNREILAVGGGAIVIDQADRELMRYKKPLKSDECRQRALLANPIVHSTVMCRRTTLDAVGGYDESIREYQDWDLWLRIMTRGNVCNLDRYLVRYRVWDGSSTSQKSMKNALSALQIVRRHRRGYRGYPVALCASLAYVLFALIPAPLRRGPTRGLSRLKKRLFNYEAPH